LVILAGLIAAFGAGDRLDAQAVPEAAAPALPQAGSPLPSLPTAQIDDKLQVVGQDLKGRSLENRLSVPVMINGRGSFAFIVDSGADSSAVGARLARALELPSGPPAMLNALTARQLVNQVKVRELKVGSSIIQDLEVPALLETDLGADGMLGIDALAQQRLMLDMEANTIRIEDGRIPWKHVPDEIVIRARRTRGQLILTQIRVGHQRVDAIIDTGSEVSIGNSALRERLFRGSTGMIAATRAIGVTGASMPIQLARLDQIRIGPADLYGPTIAFADAPPFKAFGLSDSPALLLGMDLLRAFKRVSLDFKNRKVRFELKACKPAELAASPYARDAWMRVTPVENRRQC
jgi:predicted aspartyl protease